MKASILKKQIDDQKINLEDIIDIRSTLERKLKNIKGTKHIEMNKLLANPEKFLNKNQKYYIICASGARSFQSCTQLTTMGYNVENIEDGIANYY